MTRGQGCRETCDGNHFRLKFFIKQQQQCTKFILSLCRNKQCAKEMNFASFLYVTLQNGELSVVSSFVLVLMLYCCSADVV